MLEISRSDPYRTSEDVEVILKPHIFFLDGRWHCLRQWDQKREYHHQAPDWKLLYIPENERWQGSNDHNLFIQQDVMEGWTEYCIETCFYPLTDAQGWVLFQMWHNTPLCTGLAAYVH